MFRKLAFKSGVVALLGLSVFSVVNAAYTVTDITGNGNVAGKYSKIVVTGSRVAWYGRSFQGSDTSNIKVLTHYNGTTTNLTGELPLNRTEGWGILSGADGNLAWLKATDTYYGNGNLMYFNGTSISEIAITPWIYSVNLSGPKIVWSQGEYRSSQSYGFLWENGIISQFQNEGGSNRYTSIDGDDIVYINYNSLEQQYKVKKYNNGNYTDIASVSPYTYVPQITQGEVSWLEDGRLKLFKNGVISTISNDSNVVIFSVGHHKNLLGWANLDSQQVFSIKAYNGTNVITLQTNVAWDYNVPVVVRDGLIAYAYQDKSDNKWRVKVWENGQTSLLATHDESVVAISTANGQVAWISGERAYLASQTNFQTLPCAGSLNEHRRGITSTGCPYENLRIGDKLFFLADGPNFAKTVIESNNWWAGFSWSEAAYQGVSTSGALGIIRNRNQGSTLNCPVTLSADKRGMTSQGCPFVDVKVGDALYFVADGPSYAKTIVSTNNWWAGFSWDANQTPYQGPTTSGAVAVIRK